jgi:hypothetical protein
MGVVRRRSGGPSSYSGETSGVRAEPNIESAQRTPASVSNPRWCTSASMRSSLGKLVASDVASQSDSVAVTEP